MTECRALIHNTNCGQRSIWSNLGRLAFWGTKRNIIFIIFSSKNLYLLMFPKTNREWKSYKHKMKDRNSKYKSLLCKNSHTIILDLSWLFKNAFVQGLISYARGWWVEIKFNWIVLKIYCSNYKNRLSIV